jgi:FtsH-binding integral membrane protein
MADKLLQTEVEHLRQGLGHVEEVLNRSIKMLGQARSSVTALVRSLPELQRIGTFAGNGLLSIAAPAMALALGVGCSLYFLNRKEHKFGRAFLMTLIGLVVGVVIGLQIGQLLISQLTQISLPLESFAALVTFLILWLISSFLR